MKKCFSVLVPALFAFALCGADTELAPDNPASAVFRANVERNLKRLGAKNSPVVHFAVPAMSEVMRMPDLWPSDGEFGGPVRVSLAKNEFEAGSFQLASFEDLKSVVLSVSDLKSADGAVLSAKNLDLKVVKIWYQNGNRWTSYFADVGLRLCPELLLKDENLIRVDTDEVANYARLKNPDGSVAYEWISAPRELDTGSFDPYREGFSDAETLQSVELKRGQFKQFFLTVHAAADQPAGLYSGSIGVKAGNAVYRIPLTVRVLPFELPMPYSYREPDRPFLSSMMGGFSLATDIRRFGEKLGRERFRAELVNAANHSLFYPYVDQTPEVFEMLRGAGLPTKPMFGNSFSPWLGGGAGGRFTFDTRMSILKNSKKCSEFYKKYLGHNEILLFYGDENGPAMVVAIRDLLKAYLSYGMWMGTSGHEGLFYKGGYLYGIHPMAGAPDETDRIRRWTDIGDKWIGFYANQHTGSENPQFMRRQHGLLGWFNGLNMTYNYIFATGPWNDLADELYRPMVIAYRNYGGTVDTLQWEGYREAIDDIRYATLLMREIRQAVNSGGIERRIQARKALQYIAELDYASMDLNAVRAEMIEYILKLMAMEKKG